MSYFLDKSAVDVVQNIAQKAAQPAKVCCYHYRIALGCLVRAGFRTTPRCTHTIWGVKAKPGRALGISARALSFLANGGRRCFLLLVSLTLESVLKGFSHYVQAALRGHHSCNAVYWLFDSGSSHSALRIIFKFCQTQKSSGVMFGSRGTDRTIFRDR